MGSDRLHGSGAINGCGWSIFFAEFDFAGAVIEIQATESIQVAGAAFPGDALKLVDGSAFIATQAVIAIAKIDRIKIVISTG